MQDAFLFPVPEIQSAPIVPIAVLALTGILALLAEIIWPKRKNDGIVGLSLAGILAAAAFCLLQMDESPYETMGAAVYHDRLGLLGQIIILSGAFLTILFSEPYLRSKRIPFAEFYPLVLWSTCGAMIMVSTRNLLVIFLGLEILSVALYVMAGMARGEKGSGEAALKYFLLGAFASGFLLYGIAFLYGATGSLDLGQIVASAAGKQAPREMFLFALSLITIGLGFKSSLVPFHQWTPDVYQGAPTNVSAFMATVSKTAAFLVLLRVLIALSPMSSLWMPALSVIAVLTMTVGNVMALTQKDVKRILGYSSIAQAGYLLVAVIARFGAPDQVGTGALSFYLFAYTVTTIGAFAVVSLAAKNGEENTDLSSLNGMMKRSPLAAFALLVFCMSLIGLPLTGGFIGKLQIFLDAMTGNLPWLAVALAINSVISAWYYLGIVRAALTPDKSDARVPMNLGVASACVLCLVGVLSGFFVPMVASFFNRS